MKDQWIDWLQVKRRHFFYGVILVVTTFFVAFQVAGHFYSKKFARLNGLLFKQSISKLDLSHHVPEHAAFAKTSELIVQNKLKDALAESLSLKESLSQDSILYGFNLVRIASLARALNGFAEEQSALVELEEYLDTHADANSALVECFHEGNLGLRDYIESRKR